ncbi:MAG: response regulator [Kiritimatiellae bacterium]|nr:response regulator [Kiritimatiellia bacterium]
MAKITIIDDDKDILDNTASILRGAEHTVNTMNTTEGAVDALKADTPDLLILDVMFPENPAGGFDLARKIRRDPDIRDLPIILMTGVNEEFPMDFSVDDIDPDWMPVQDFLEKPASVPVLLEHVQKMLEAAT